MLYLMSGQQTNFCVVMLTSDELQPRIKCRLKQSHVQNLIPVSAEMIYEDQEVDH